MKFIYTILFFMIFLNIATFLFIGLGIFPYSIASGGNYSEDMSGEELFEDLSDADFDDIASLAITNIDLIAIIAGGGALAWLTHSPAPLAVGIFLGIFINTFRRSTAIFAGFNVNEHIYTAMFVGIIFLFVITLIEYFTQGDV